MPELRRMFNEVTGQKRNPKGENDAQPKIRCCQEAVTLLRLSSQTF
jgi:hypothetical protein